MSLRIEDCIAMSETGEWFAFPATATRGQVISAVAADSSWFDVLRLFHVKQGFVFQGTQDGEAWYWECDEHDACAIPAWIVKRR
jgi:hypothetical protein